MHKAKLTMINISVSHVRMAKDSNEKAVLQHEKQIRN